MARFKPIHKGLKLLPVDFDRQIIPGSFEYALCHLVDHELDLTTFHKRYNNDVDGAPAFDPAVLIKIILLAYSHGIIHSRKIEAACRENVRHRWRQAPLQCQQGQIRHPRRLSAPSRCWSSTKVLTPHRPMRP